MNYKGRWICSNDAAGIAEALVKPLKEKAARGEGYMRFDEVVVVLYGKPKKASLLDALIQQMGTTLDLPGVVVALRKLHDFPMATTFVDDYVDLFRAVGKKPLHSEISTEETCLLAGGRGKGSTGIVVDDEAMFDVSRSRFGTKSAGLIRSAVEDVHGAVDAGETERKRLPATMESLRGSDDELHRRKLIAQ